MTDMTPDHDETEHGKPKSRSRVAPLAKAGLDHGMSQVSLVETALCPLDYRPGESLRHISEFIYYDSEKRRKVGKVTVKSPSGLSPTDELILYGLLAITFADSKPMMELSATPHFICRQLGLPIGGDHYKRLRESMRRLSEVTYQNSAWWDKPRGQHRELAFHFLSYDLPTDAGLDLDVDEHGREPWTIFWDPLFFRLMNQSRGFIWFDFASYRALKNAAARRGFLLLQKIFHHREVSPQFDLRAFAVEQLGYSAELEMKSIRQKVKLLIRTWQEQGIVNAGVDAEEFFIRKGPGKWSICLPRGPRFTKAVPRPWTRVNQPMNHPAYEILQRLEMGHQEIVEIFSRFSDQMIAVTQAAMTAESMVRQGKTDETAKQIFLGRLSRIEGHGIEQVDDEADRKSRIRYERRRQEAENDWETSRDSNADVNEEIERLTSSSSEPPFQFPEYELWLKGEGA